MEIDLLGPPTMRNSGRTVHIGGQLHQLVISMLLTEPVFISTESLIDLVWPSDDPDVAVPRDPRARLYEVVSDIRRVLRDVGGDALLPHRRYGYHAQVHRDQVDLLRFHDRRRAARVSQEAADFDKAVRQYREAFREWRTEISPPAVQPYAGLTGRWVRNQRERLRSAYLTDVLACIDLELRLGQSRRLVPELVSLNDAYPLDEQISRMLMLAQYRSGQTAESLVTYASFRERLDNELGTEPGETLQELHRQILRQDQALLAHEEPIPVVTRKGHDVNEYFTNSMDGVVGGSFAQISKLYGDVSFGAPEPSEAAMAKEIRDFRRSVRDARRAGDLPAPTADAVEVEITRALAFDDDFADVMDGIRHLVDGAPCLVAHADELIDLAQRSAR